MKTLLKQLGTAKKRDAGAGPRGDLSINISFELFYSGDIYI